MLVQYEENQPPPLTSTWSTQDTKGSSVLIFLAWLGLLVGACGALYWAHLSILGAIYGTADWPGYVWLAFTAAGAALIAPVMWPFLSGRRPEIAQFVLFVGIVSWVITSLSGTAYMIAKSQYRPASLETSATGHIEAALAKDNHSVNGAQEDCDHGVWRGCEWLNSRDGHETRLRVRQYDAELKRRASTPTPPVRLTATNLSMTLRQRLLLLGTVMLGGAIALAMVWGPAEALKAMYSEPGTLAPKPIGVLSGLPGGDLGVLGNPVDMAAETWASQCLERARGERVELAVLHAHYRAFCVQRGLPTFENDAAFGRWFNRPRDPNNPADLGGPATRFQAFPLKTGGRMSYLNVRIKPDAILDDIEFSGGEHES